MPQVLSREFERERRRTHLEAATLNALHELAIASGTRGLRAVARLAVDHARALLGVEAAVIFDYDEERNLLLPVGETESAAAESPVLPGQGAIGLAFETCVPVIVPDYTNWEHALPGSAARGMISAIAVPLISGDHPIGVLGAWTYSRRAFTAEDEQLLMLFAAQVAPAIEAGRLNQQRQNAASIFEALHQMAVATGGMHDPGQVALLCVEQACRLLQTENALLLGWDEEQNLLLPLADNLEGGAAGFRLRPGQGAAGMAFRSRGPVTVNDYQGWRHASRTGLRRGVRSVLCVPLLVRDRAVGALEVISLAPREFVPRERDVLTLLASQIAPALEAARLIETSAAQVRELRAMHGLAVAAGGVLEPRRLAAMVVGEARALLGADRGLLRVYEPATGRLEPLADTRRHGRGGASAPGLRLGEGLAGAVFESARPMAVEDYPSWGGATAWATREGFKSGVTVPLVSHQRPIGTLGAFTTTAPRKFSEAEIRLLSLLAAQVAPALEAARLADAVQQRARILAALHDLAVAAGDVLEPDRVAALAGAAARELIGVDRVVVAVLDPGQGRLEAVSDTEAGAQPPPPIRPGEGSAGTAYSRRRAVRVADHQAEEGGLSWAARNGYRSSLSVPLEAHDTAIGSMTLLTRKPRTFDDDTGDLVSLLAAQVAPTIEAARLHASLAASERTLRAIYDTAPVGIARHDLSGELLWLNRAGCEMFGYSEEELRGLTGSALIADEDTVADRHLLAGLVSGRIARYRVTRRYVKKDGSRFWGDVTYSLVRNEEGRPDFYFSQIDDVTERVEAEVALRASEARKSAILESALDCVIGADDSGRIVEFNPAAERVFGRRRAQVLGMALAEILDLPDVRARVAGRFETTGLLEDGTRFPVEVSIGSFEQGDRAMLSVAVRDLTEQHRAEAARRESEERFRAVFDRAAIGIARLDLQGQVIEANPALYRMLGQLEGTLTGVHVRRLVHPEDRSALRLDRLASGDASEHQVELRYLRGEADGVWGNTIASSVRGARGEPQFLTLMVEDITLRKAHEAALEHRALHDPLTDLPNRTLLQDRLHVALAKGRRDREVGALLLVDLDGFKQVNDVHGHAAGDVLLKQIAARMRAGLRGSDTVARLGGDEFAIVLPDVGGPEGAMRTAIKLHDSLERPFTVDGHAIAVSASIGVALFPTHSSSAEELMRQADAAMYGAKRARAGSLLFDPEQDAGG